MCPPVLFSLTPHVPLSPLSSCTRSFQRALPASSDHLSPMTASKTTTEIIIRSFVPQFSQLFSLVRQLAHSPKRPVPRAWGVTNTRAEFCGVAKAESPSRSTAVALDTLLKPSAPEGRRRPHHLPQTDCSTGPVLALLPRAFPRLRSDEPGVRGREVPSASFRLVGTGQSRLSRGGSKRRSEKG